ncbi:MAG TPA: heavy metal-associated domain-containing protein [Edaphobacter sp.]|nr:heavy metal-associated domain-containing protein [Edaphobacter sp.]
MKTTFALGFLLFTSLAAHAEYEQVNLTVFGMDCAPCAHAIHVSMKGIQGVNTVDVDLNTGLVAIKLTPGNSAAMHQFNEAVEKNGFTHKDATIIVRGQLSGSAQAPFLEVSGTKDRYALTPLASGMDLSGLLGKTVLIDGVLPQSGKGKVSDTLRYKSVTEAK